MQNKLRFCATLQFQLESIWLLYFTAAMSNTQVMQQRPGYKKQWNLVSRRMTHSGFGPQRCWNWNPQDSSLCSLCSLLKGTKGTKKTFGLIFIQARKFLLNLRVQAGLTKCIFALDFHVCLHVSVHFWPLTIFWWLSAVNVSLLQFELSKNVVTSKWKWTYIFMS